MELTFTTIEEPARAIFGISRDEYALCNYIQVWSSHPANRVPGYCDRTRQQMADFIGMTERGVRKMLERLTIIGLIEPSASARYYRITVAWFEEVSLAKSRRKAEQSSGFDARQAEQSSGQSGTKFRVKAEQSSGLGGNKVPPHKEYNKEHNKGKKDIPVSSVSATPDPEPEKKKKAPPVSAPPPEVIRVVEYLNQLTGAAYRPGTKTTAGMVKARLSEGFTVEDFETVIAFKCRQWLNDKKMRDYLRPETLFSPSHFESYLNQARLALQNQRNDQQQPQHGKFTFDPAAAINRAAQLVEELRRERAPSGG